MKFEIPIWLDNLLTVAILALILVGIGYLIMVICYAVWAWLF